MRKKFILNSLSGVFQFVIFSALLFAIIPVFISKMGLHNYGIFSLFILLGNLHSLLNLGLNSALVKFLSEQGKTKESNTDIIVAIFILSCILLPFFVISYVFVDFIILNIFGLPKADLTNDVYYLYYFLIISNLFAIVSLVISSILDAQEKIYLTNFIQVIYTIIYWASILVVLFINPVFSLIGLVILGSSLIYFFLIIFFSVKEWGFFSVEKELSHYKRSLKKQLSYCIKIYLTGTISLLFEPLSKLFISNYIGITPVAYYEIALRIKQVVWSIFSKLFYPVFPMIGKVSQEKIREIIHNIEQKYYWFAAPLMISILFVTAEVMQLWLNNDEKMISISVIAIVFLSVINLGTVPNYMYLLAKNRADKTIIMQVVNVVVNLIFFFVFLRWLGYYAIVVSNSATLIASLLMGVYYQKKYLNSVIFDSFKQFTTYLIICLILLITGFALNIFITNNLMQIALIPIVLFVITFILLRQFSVITVDEINRYVGNNATVSNILKKVFVK